VIRALIAEPQVQARRCFGEWPCNAGDGNHLSPWTR